MNRGGHVPTRTSCDAARRAIDESADWPGALGVGAEALDAELVWVPFDVSVGRSLADPSDDPRLAKLKLSGDFLVVAREESPPPEETGRTIAGATADSLFVPFWVFAHAGSEGWAAVDAVSGRVAGGELPAAHGPALARLAFFGGLAVFDLFLGASYVFVVVALVVGFARPIVAMIFPAASRCSSSSAMVGQSSCAATE